MSFKLKTRNHQSELMDDPLISGSVHRQALQGLRRVNWLSRTESVVWRQIGRLARTRTTKQTLTILDIASGGGDVAIRLAQTAQRKRLSIAIDGCDISQTAVEYATEQSSAAGLENVRFHLCNALQQPLPKVHYDVVMCSLFLHHLSIEDSVTLLRKMKSAATQLVLIDDLRRSPLGYWMAWVGCRLLTRCRIVHIDGPMSVEGAFTIDEVRDIAEQAGLTGVSIDRHWPQRFVLTWSPGDGDAHAQC